MIIPIHSVLLSAYRVKALCLGLGIKQGKGQSVLKEAEVQGGDRHIHRVE